MLTIRDFISPKVVMLPEDAPVYEAARAMADNNIGSVIVRDAWGNITGVVTDRDIACKGVGEKKDPETPLSDVMSSDVVAVSEDATIDDVVSVMTKNGVRRIPVLNEETGKCSGIISADDLILSRFISEDESAAIIRSQLLWDFGRRPALARAARRKEAEKEEFYSLMAEAMGTEKEYAEQFIRALLPLIMRRILFTEALDLISRLPEQVTDQLDIQTGPDTSLDAEKIVQETSRQTGANEDEILTHAPLFWQGLEVFLGEDSSQKGELSHVLSQLPKDIQSLLGIDADSAHRVQ